MAFLASIVMVLGTFGLVVWNMWVSDTGQEGIGVAQMIHAPLPWLVIVALVVGVMIGIASLWAKPRWYKWPVIALECFVAAVMLWYVTTFSWLPDRELAVAVGDTFPAYSLPIHDGSLREFTAGNDRDLARRLYIFYRGDW